MFIFFFWFQPVQMCFFLLFEVGNKTSSHMTSNTNKQVEEKNDTKKPFDWMILDVETEDIQPKSTTSWCERVGFRWKRPVRIDLCTSEQPKCVQSIVISSLEKTGDWKETVQDWMDRAKEIYMWSRDEWYGSLLYHKHTKPWGWKEDQLIDWRMKTIPVRETMWEARRIRLPMRHQDLVEYNPSWKGVHGCWIVGSFVGLIPSSSLPTMLTYMDTDWKTKQPKLRKTSWKRLQAMG